MCKRRFCNSDNVIMQLLCNSAYKSIICKLSAFVQYTRSKMMSSRECCSISAYETQTEVSYLQSWVMWSREWCISEDDVLSCTTRKYFWTMGKLEKYDGVFDLKSWVISTCGIRPAIVHPSIAYILSICKLCARALAVWAYNLVSGYPEAVCNTFSHSSIVNAAQSSMMW